MTEPAESTTRNYAQTNETIDENDDIKDESPSCWRTVKKKFHFGWTYIKPPIAYIWDVIIDIYRTVYYFLQTEYVIGGISASVIIISILASMKYKWQMNMKEYRRNTAITEQSPTENHHLNGEGNSSQTSERQEPTFLQKLLNSIVLVWYWRKLREAWTSGDLKSKNDYMIDTSLLGILENFLENAPQLNITWFYVFWVQEEITFAPSTIMKSISLLLLTWSIPSYTKAVKRARGEENLTNCNKLLLFLWNVLQIVPRFLIISIFAAQYPIHALIYLGCHTVIMIILLLIVVEENPNLYNTRCLKTLHCIVFGIMYIYTYIDIADEKHKTKAIVLFYIVSLAGNSGMAFYFLFTTASFILVGIYYLGVVFMILHYVVGNFCIKR